MQNVVPEYSVYYVEIVTPDVKGACDLYKESYGWDFKPMTPELGNACVADLADGSLFGIRAPMHSSEKPIVRNYLRVTDLQACVEKAASLGAHILLDHMEIPGRGTIAIYEIGGIEQGLWQIE